MNSRTFKLNLKQGTLGIPPEVIEYLQQCTEDIEVFLTIQSSENTTLANSQTDYQAKWNRWFSEVEQLEPSSSQLELDKYGKALLEKYKKQGLEL